MDRRALAAVVGLSVLSVAVLFGSVMTALASFEDQDVAYSALDIPEGLLIPEAIDAVRHRPATPDLAAELTESPSPSPVSKASPRVTRSPAAPKIPRFEISMVSSAKGRGGKRTFNYEITVRNVGETALAGLVVRSHVPVGTVWAPSPTCDRSGHELLVTYPDANERLCMAGSQVISGDETSHPVEATLRSIAPGASVKLSFSVDVVSGKTGTVVNHAHLSGGGMELQSAPSAQEASGTQLSGQSAQ